MELLIALQIHNIPSFLSYSTAVVVLFVTNAPTLSIKYSKSQNSQKTFYFHLSYTYEIFAFARPYFWFFLSARPLYFPSWGRFPCEFCGKLLAFECMLWRTRLKHVLH